MNSITHLDTLSALAWQGDDIIGSQEGLHNHMLYYVACLVLVGSAM